MRVLKKYPNRRLYDTQNSVYVTLEDVRQMVLANESIQVVDSKSGADLTRSVLLQIIAEQEGEGHEPLLTNRVLQQLIRFYGDSMQGVLSRYIEQSVMVFLQQQELYQRRMRDVLSASPVKLVQKLADQNLNFWRNLIAREQQERHEDGPPQASELRPPPPPPFDAEQQSGPRGGRDDRNEALPGERKNGPDSGA
ncbi:MAG: polyhydroxyalkanoate synthesis repressor PhaR [Gammaproteobacteria bacterium]|nr:MAG: polyhydroxyalkanoate synthesis repressor PhaR [Gammaproteobacteria bacterium]